VQALDLTKNQASCALDAEPTVALEEIVASRITNSPIKRPHVRMTV